MIHFIVHLIQGPQGGTLLRGYECGQPMDLLRLPRLRPQDVLSGGDANHAFRQRPRSGSLLLLPTAKQQNRPSRLQGQQSVHLQVSSSVHKDIS